jgi:hypothetical protein
MNKDVLCHIFPTYLETTCMDDIGKIDTCSHVNVFQVDIQSRQVAVAGDDQRSRCFKTRSFLKLDINPPIWPGIVSILVDIKRRYVAGILPILRHQTISQFPLSHPTLELPLIFPLLPPEAWYQSSDPPPGRKKWAYECHQVIGGQ